ncbi:MAG: 16S rRNA (guanine(527)-N(7))-methyltransferase RsmG [Desulfarculaceae bacterium]|nr:16S rRNA (guanine(527)-N(7))-methyltransferase RsmG [Desulfarculaceae bacterium]
MDKRSTAYADPQFSSGWRNTIKEGCACFGVAPEPHCFELFSVHASLLLQWNRKVNLTAIRDPFEIAVKHFIDSAALLPHIEPYTRVLDIGTGAGFPAIPVKICSPGLDMVCMDASRKKISFVKEAIRQCRLDGIKAVHARTEELAKDNNLSNSFDVVTSRAFSSLDQFVEQAAPFLAPNGTILAMKGKRTDLEEERSHLNRPYRMEVFDYPLPFIHDERCIIKVRPSDDSS